MSASNGSAHPPRNGAQPVPPPPPPDAGGPLGTRQQYQAAADQAALRRSNYPLSGGQRPSRRTKVEIGKVNLAPDVSLPPLTLSINKTTVVQGASGGGAGHKATPGSGFTSDEDIRAYSEAVRKAARPRSVERSLDAEVLESALRQIPDQYGSMRGSRARARKVVRHLKRIAACEKFIAKQASALYASFTREFEAELAQISSGRRRGDPRQPPRRKNSIWK